MTDISTKSKTSLKKQETEDSKISDSLELVPEMMVSVRIEEKDGSLDFSSNSELNKDAPKKMRQRIKKPETSEIRQERLQKDRERKSWARHNETPEKRKARLEYHKKYKRKTRAKPKEPEQTKPSQKDRERKSWARHNETPEQRKARLEYHKKYNRKARAKPKEPEQTKPSQIEIKEDNIINWDPLSQSETIIVKVEPVDFDDDSNIFPPNDSDITQNESDFTQNESDSTPNESKFLSRDELAYTIQCAIVGKMFKGRPLDDICKLYNVTPKVVNEIWENREKYEIQKPGQGSYKHMNAKIEKHLLEWIEQQKDSKIAIARHLLSGKMIQNAAERYANELGFIAFDGSKKWLDRFKKKHDIMFRTRKRDYTATPDNKCKTQFFDEQWLKARVSFSDEDIYTADEVGLFYNPSKDRIQKQRGKKFVQGCIKDRLSIFLCTNVSGSVKKKLLVCGSEDPLLHSHRDPQTLPVLYARHAQAHFTTRIFENYVTSWNRELEQSNKKALLILDRATIHTKLQLSNLKLLFVPYKTKSSLIPIRNGVYTRFRAEFRRLILVEKVMNCMNGIDRNLTCLEALSMLEKAWERIPPEVITMSFFTLGYDVYVPDKKSVLSPRVSENDEESMCDILKNYDVEHYYKNLSLLDEYLTVDDDLLTGQGTNASVFGGNHKATPKEDVEEHLPIGTEKPESAKTEVTVKKKQALQDLDIVKKHLQSTDTPLGMYCAFMEIEKFVTHLPK